MRVWREQVIGRPNKDIFTEAEYEARIPFSNARLKDVAKGLRFRLIAPVSIVNSRHSVCSTPNGERRNSGYFCFVSGCK